MNIGMHSFSRYAVSFFQESVLPVLTAQQKKIVGIASLALVCLAACLTAWYVLSGYDFKAKPLKDEWGTLNGRGERRDINGDLYKGVFKDGFLYGLGTIEYRDGTREEGRFRKGALNGFGERICSDGRVLKGKFKHHWLTEGSITYPGPEKRVGKGYFEGDVLVKSK